MDKYDSIHGKDVSSFDYTSTHRLPTISAAQAFDDLETGSQHHIRTGLDALDQTLAGVSFDNNDGPPHQGGIQKGQIVEVWGPPASGKTTFAMQVAANTIQDGHKVVWVDTSHALCRRRFSEIISLSRLPDGTTTCPDIPANLLHYSTPSLAHLVGLLCKPKTSSIPRGTSLVVIDGLSGLINRAFPKTFEPRQMSKASNPAVRRLKVLQYLISALQKLSATQDLLVLLLSQCATRMQAERSAAIAPAINVSAWEQGIASRLVFFQDWTVNDTDTRSVRLIGVQKNNGQTTPNGLGLIFPFEICNHGLSGLDLEIIQPSLANSRRRKRKLDGADDEIADSEGEEYGWEQEDEAEMPRMPPQWQGSEDLILGPEEDDDNLTAELSELDDNTP